MTPPSKAALRLATILFERFHGHGIHSNPGSAVLHQAEIIDLEWQPLREAAEKMVEAVKDSPIEPSMSVCHAAHDLSDALAGESVAPVICDGCNVREPWEHRCHGKPCECPRCRESVTPRNDRLREAAKGIIDLIDRGQLVESEPSHVGPLLVQSLRTALEMEKV